MPEPTSEAEFNQAKFEMQRLHDLMVRVDMCNVNPLDYNLEFGLDNYRVMFNDLNSVMFLISSKMTAKELIDMNILKKFISDFLQTCRVWDTNLNSTLGGNRINKELNQLNWNILKQMFEVYRLELERLKEVHRIGNPSKDDPRRAIVSN